MKWVTSLSFPDSAFCPVSRARAGWDDVPQKYGETPTDLMHDKRITLKQQIDTSESGISVTRRGVVIVLTTFKDLNENRFYTTDYAMVINHLYTGGDNLSGAWK